jgi:hypothetical protein
MPQIFVLPRQVALDDDANPLSGALAYFYQTGTTTLQAVYSDRACTTPHSNPLEADTAGRFPKAYYNPNASANYRVRITTASGTQLYQEDDIDRFTISSDEILDAVYDITTRETTAGLTLADIDQRYPPGNVYRYGTNTTPGTTDMTTAIQRALDCNDVIELPDDEIAFTSLTWRFRRTIRGQGPRNSVLKQLASMNGSSTPAITLDPGKPPAGFSDGTDISDGCYRADNFGVLVTSQTGIYCNSSSMASMFMSDQLRLVSRQAALNGPVPYSTISNQRAIWFEAGGVTSAFFSHHRNLEIRAFDLAVEASGGVNEWTLHGWIIDCRVAIRLSGSSTWDMSGLTIESGVQNARALQTFGACSNLKWIGGRWELTQSGSYGIEGDGTTTGNNWRFAGINVLIDSDASAIPGRKWTGTLPNDVVFEGYDASPLPFIIIPNLVTLRLPNLLTLGGTSLGNALITLGRNAGGAACTIGHDGTHMEIRAGNSLELFTGATLPAATLDDSIVAGNTRLLLYDVDNGQLERVTVGAADSGGTGFKLLRIQN